MTMKIIVISIIISVFCINYVKSDDHDYLTTIKTPTNVSIESYHRIEAPAPTLAAWESQAAHWITVNTSNAERVAPASRTYNCHCYAWHKSDGGDSYWVNQLNINYQSNLSKYWSGASPTYQTTSSSKATKVFYPYGDHSAKIITPSLYESKWGNWPRYRHAPTDCPYNSTELRYYGIPVNGNSLICSSSSCSILNISGASYNWTYDNVTIGGSGYQVSVYRNGDGAGWIKTQISSPYSGTQVQSIVKDLWLGNPPSPDLSPPSPIEMNLNDPHPITIVIEDIGPAGPITAYSWSKHGFSINWLSDPDDPYFTASPNSQGNTLISCRINNACGQSDFTQGWIVVTDWEEKMSSPLAVYPNPVSTYINITFDGAKLNEPLEEFLANIASSKKSSYFRIIDMYGEVKLMEIYKGAEETTIDVSDLKEGVYGLQLVLREKVYQTLFLISRK